MEDQTWCLRALDELHICVSDDFTEDNETARPLFIDFFNFGKVVFIDVFQISD